ncbi:MAG: AMP-binding protein [Myxococcales bacterium]|nr:MAG: AMP-binding protein [Myxococcales bacterium]
MTHDRLFDMPLLPHLIIDGLNRYDDRPFLFLGDTTVTYAEVRAQASRFAQALASKGVEKGSRTAILSANRPEVLYNLCANMVLGSCNTPLHPLGSAEDQAYVLEDAGIETLVYDAAYFGQRAAELEERVPGLKNLLGFGPSDAGEDLNALAATYEPRPLVAPDIGANDLNTIVYTGGTTGRPKGVRQPYRSAAYMTMVQTAEWEWPEEIRFLIATPLSHAAAAFVVPTLQAGGAFVALQGFTPDLFFDAIEQHRITSTFLVPVMIYPLLDHPRAETADLSSLETLFYGASPMSPSRLKEGVEKWGQIFFQCFGQSEAPMALTHLKKKEHDLSKPERFASCGRPSPWVHLALLDDENQPVAEGEAGEICVRAPLVMEGYNGLPEQTEEAFAGGWLHTGDVGRFDDDGYLYIVDRKKDMIVTGGFNVFPREIEDVISAHPPVAMVAVVGVPEEKWGEAVKAVVVLKPGHEGSEELADEIKAAVKEAKGAVQAPKSVDFVAQIPLSALGKPDKKALRKQFWGDQERGVN